MRLLLIISGGIAAYKSLDLIRRARERGIATRVIMTKAAGAFITPLAVEAISGDRVFTELFDREDEHDIGHIRLSREADAVLVAPATADLMAKAANGLADDLATTVLLASNKPVLMAPAMNPQMWSHSATQRNTAQLAADGVRFIGPEAGEMAERGEAGVGRMAEVPHILDALEDMLADGASGATRDGALAGRHVLVTAGPTHEAIDPVRYIANRSSGKQGYAVAAAARDLGARVTLVSGPVQLEAPAGIERVSVESARDMAAAVDAALPADIAVFTAAVADWRVDNTSGQKMKKTAEGTPDLSLTENPDILAGVASRKSGRPKLVIGFAAETENVEANARQKLARKGCDWIVANDVSAAGGAMGGDDNLVHIVRSDGIATWPRLAKREVAARLMAEAADALGASTADARQKSR
ncbi:MAG: bifunctional phosphopantothenoylcysteine decarboxylase/phosphopantothenate--cysteine ligase CoaBC [Pseudomonadota bacterium]